MVRGGKRPDRRRRRGIRDYPMWLAATVAVGLLALPWVIALALAPHHHLDVTLVTILVAVTIGLATLWLTWAAVRTAANAVIAERLMKLARTEDLVLHGTASHKVTRGERYTR